MEKYFNYPLSLLQRIKNDNDKKGLLDVVSFAVMSFSEKIGYKIDSISKQIIYMYYRRPYFLTANVKDRLDYLYNIGTIEEDEDYHGFARDSFYPETEATELLKELKEDPGFYNECIDVYRQHQALSLLKLNPELITDLRQRYNDISKFIQSFEKTNGTDAWSSVSNEVLFNCYNDTLSMDHFRLISAVKSVLGKRNFNLTYKSVLLSRMFGCKKMHLLSDLVSSDPELQSKYSVLCRRRQWEKLIDTATTQNYISYYCTGRQFFVSVTMSKLELQNAVNQRKQNFAKVSISV